MVVLHAMSLCATWPVMDELIVNTTAYQYEVRHELQNLLLPMRCTAGTIAGHECVVRGSACILMHAHYNLSYKRVCACTCL